MRVRLGPLAPRHWDDLGAWSPRAVAQDPADRHGWGEQTLLVADRRMAVAALLALAPEIGIITPDDPRDDLVMIALEPLEQQRLA